MLYCVSVGVVLQAVLLPNGGTHRPWKKLSGVRFSWKITMMCRKFEICPYAKEERIDASALMQRLLTTNFMGELHTHGEQRVRRAIIGLELLGVFRTPNTIKINRGNRPL